LLGDRENPQIVVLGPSEQRFEDDDEDEDAALKK
jgi:hypothetical protein